MLHLDEKDEKELSYVLKFGDEEMIQSCVESISGRMRQTKAIQSSFQAYIIDILSVILRVVQKNGLEENIVFGKYTDYNGVLTGIRDSADMQDWLCEVCFAISGKLYRERVGTTQTLIEKAKKYIGEMCIRDRSIVYDLFIYRCPFRGTTCTYMERYQF